MGIWIALSFIPVVVFVVSIVVSLLRERNRRDRVWCIWGDSRRVGFISRSKFDEYSRKHWRQTVKYRALVGDTLNVHMHPPEKDIIVLSMENFVRALDGLRLEWREFYVPETTTLFREAYQRLHGRPMSGDK